MRALVTGASGFVGYHVARVLVEAGWEVRALVRPLARTEFLTALGVELAIGDVTDAATVERAMAGCSAAFHAAGLYSIWEPDPRRFYRVNVMGTVNVLKAARQLGIGDVVYTSTRGTLRPALPDRPATEDEPIGEADLARADHYIQSKVLAEQEVLRFVADGFPVRIVNPTAPVGSHDWRPTPTGRILLDPLRGRLPGQIPFCLNWTAVDDVARGHLLALERGRPGERYILGGENLWLRDILRLLRFLTGHSLRVPRLPVPAMMAAAYVAEFAAERLAVRPPLLTPAIVRVLHAGQAADPSKAVRELGLPQTPVREAVAAAIQWYVDAGMLPPHGGLRPS
ncbi:MAG: NAD-dependent epimerase/dehydratase family protein [Chloroflexi bacterium]|nr:NAD-dependent epimerase/dehydratase family protein [Chloroflexota bacterium]